MSIHNTNNELRRIADALEKIANALTTPIIVTEKWRHKEAPYWQHPQYKAPEVK